MKKLIPLDELISAAEKELYISYKKIGALYKEISGKKDHYSDCATNNAPAMMPDRCDCDL